MRNRLKAAWLILTAKKYWVFTRHPDRVMLSKGWTTSESRDIVKQIHRGVYAALKPEEVELKKVD